MRLKAEGVTAGVPDLFFAWPRGGYHGLWIEMKRKGGKVSNLQAEMMSYLGNARYLTAVCYGTDEAKKTLKEYML